MLLRFASTAPRIARSRVLPRTVSLASWAVGLLVVAMYGAVALRIHARFGTGMDLAIFDQAVRNLAAGHAPTSSMKAVGMNLWGDHFHPILLLAVPAYWLRPDPSTLLLLQAGSLGLTCALVHRTTARMLPGNRGAGPVGALSLAAGAGVQSGMTFDVHEVALGMPLVALALGALLRRRWRRFGLWCCSLLLVKEDAGLLVFGLAITAFVLGTRRLALALATAATLWTLLVIKVVIPAMSPTGAWLYSSAVQDLASSLRSAAASLHGGRGLAATCVTLLSAGCFLALRSPLALALLPSLAVRAASGNPAYWGIGYHYNLLPSVVLAHATIDTLRRCHRQRLFLAAIALVGLHSALTGQAVAEALTHHDPHRITAAQRAIDTVPPGASVAADVYLTPHLTHDHPITQKLLPPHYTDDLGHPINADWIIIDTHPRSYRNSPTWPQQAASHLTTRGFHQTQRCGDYLVLTRT